MAATRDFGEGRRRLSGPARTSWTVVTYVLITTLRSACAQVSAAVEFLLLAFTDFLGNQLRGQGTGGVLEEQAAQRYRVAVG